MVHENLTITIKKATELYVMGGVAFDPDLSKYVFWYAVRKYPAMSRETQRQTGTKSMTEYIQKFRPSWEGGDDPPDEYEDFYKKLPSVFEEGSKKRIERARPGDIGPSMIIIGPTKIDYNIEATGDAKEDVPVVEQIIRQIRELIWDFPVEGTFTSITGLQSDKLLQFINTNLKRAFKTMRLSKIAKGFRILPETVRYIDIATGTIFNSENAVQQAIKEYHEEQESELDLEPMLAAASKGGIVMNIGELLKIANLLDESGDQAGADEITSIVEQIVEDSKKTAWVGRVVNTLTKVANSLDEKGATEEAQLADSILQSLQTDLPQAFESQSTTVTETEPTPIAQTIEVVEDVVQDSQLAEAPQTTTEAPQTETPFGQLDKNPSEVKIDETKESEPAFDKVSVDELKGMIHNLKWRHSQSGERQAFEETLKRAEKAQEYFKAYKEWLDFAHAALGDRPIRLKIE